MSKWLKLSLLALFSLFLASSSPAQGFFTGNAWRYTPAGIFAASGASVQVCTAFGTGTPCTPTISLFKDAALAQPVSNPLPVCSGTPPQFGCIDGLGNFSFYAATTGPYVYTITGVGLTAYGPIPITATNSTIGLGANLAFTGIDTMSDLNGGKYVDGSKYATLAAAFAACQSTGCVIDMRGNPSVLALGTFDPGATTPVTLLLGPYAYTAVQFTLRVSFVMQGYTSGLTTITSVGSNATPLFVIPQTNNYAAQEVYMRGIQFIGAAGNTSQDGLFADSSTLTNAGLWYSNFDDLIFRGFKGSGIHLKGTVTGIGALNQFVQFRNCVVFGPSGRTNSLRIEGANNQIEFYGGEYDGSVTGDGGTNIYVGTSGVGTTTPLTINFYDVTTQSASIGVTINGVQQVGFRGTHLENLFGGFNVTATTAQNYGLTIETSYFAGTVGVNAGSGYDLNVATGLLSGQFKHNYINGAPDKVIAGTNLMNLAVADNVYSAPAPYPTTTTNITRQMSPAASLDTGASHSVTLNASATVITTINSMLGPGEIIAFRALGSTVSFGTGGNLDLGSNASPIVLSSADTALFMREDTEWNLVGYSRIGTPTQTIASGTTALGVGAIAATNCAGGATTAATGVLATDAISWSPNLGAVGGYTSATGSGLVVYAVPTANNVNFFVCNPTAGSITPSAATVNWRVVR